MAVDSNRIVNMMRADDFFYQKRGKAHLRKIEAERFGLSVADAKKILQKSAEKVEKHSTRDINFEEWQLEVAERVFGKGSND